MKRRLSLQTECDILSTRQAEYLLSKSRHGRYEYGEKIGRILAHQVRQRTANQTIPAINDEQGLKSTDSLKINSCFQNVYESLYTSELSTTPSEMEDFLRSLHVPSLDPVIADMLEKDLSALEIISAIRSMQSGKSPGPDGYPADFFKRLSDQLAPLSLSVYEESLTLKTLPLTTRQAVFFCNSQKRKKTHWSAVHFAQFLCLTLMQKFLPKFWHADWHAIISPDQAGFIKNQYSFFNVRRLFNIVYSPTWSARGSPLT